MMDMINIQKNLVDAIRSSDEPTASLTTQMEIRNMGWLIKFNFSPMM
jgi:hypothetical protein